MRERGGRVKALADMWASLAPLTATLTRIPLPDLLFTLHRRGRRVRREIGKPRNRMRTENEPSNQPRFPCSPSSPIVQI